MARGDKPYRVYRGGRARGKVPIAGRPEAESREERRARRAREAAAAPRRPRWGRRIGIAIVLLAVLLVVWLVASYLAFRTGVANANNRLPQEVEASLATQDGLLTSQSTLILLLGTDGDRTAARGDRQQAVVEALTAKVVSPTTFLKLPFVGDEIVKPLTTDLSAGELLQLGWVRFRANASRSLHCRLGGELAFVSGQSVIIGDEENFEVIRMFDGTAATQPPPPGQPLAAGCVVGSGNS